MRKLPYTIAVDIPAVAPVSAESSQVLISCTPSQPFLSVQKEAEDVVVLSLLLSFCTLVRVEKVWRGEAWEGRRLTQVCRNILRVFKKITLCKFF